MLSFTGINYCHCPLKPILSFFSGSKKYWCFCTTRHTTYLHLPSHRNARGSLGLALKMSSSCSGYSLYLLWDKYRLWQKCASLLPVGPACILHLNFCVVFCVLEPCCLAVGRYCCSSIFDCFALHDGWCGWARAEKMAACQE